MEVIYLCSTILQKIEESVPHQIVGFENLKRFVKAYIDSATPILFYNWGPTQFLAETIEKSVRVALPESLDFPKSALFKYAKKTVHPHARKFLSRLKVTNLEINQLLLSYSKRRNAHQVACEFLNIDSNFQRIYRMIPKETIL